MQDIKKKRILFMSLSQLRSIKDYGIYPDLLREYIKHGAVVYILTPVEKLSVGEQRIIKEGQSVIIKVETGRIQKTSVIEKGINTVLLEQRYINAIKKYFSKIRFDLVLYPTPPITLAGAVEHVKKRDGAKTFLLLKDIFPQNAVDIGILTKSGVKGVLYRYFRRKEKKLYRLSDGIGCMSPANVKYVLEHNPKVEKNKVYVCPNSVEPQDLRVKDKNEIRAKYGLPLDKKIFIYGGNLGRPQDVPFIIECFKACKDSGAYFVVAGSGTDRHYLEKYVQKEKPEHVKLFGYIPQQEYDRMVACCDVGLIFLDHRFRIPNFPSRLISLMQAGLPVLCCTDKNTDIGDVVVENGFGWKCESNSAVGFRKVVEKAIQEANDTMGNRSFVTLKKLYDVRDAYKTIEKYFETKE